MILVLLLLLQYHQVSCSTFFYEKKLNGIPLHSISGVLGDHEYSRLYTGLFNHGFGMKRPDQTYKINHLGTKIFKSNGGNYKDKKSGIKNYQTKYHLVMPNSVNSKQNIKDILYFSSVVADEELELLFHSLTHTGTSGKFPNQNLYLGPNTAEKSTGGKLRALQIDSQVIKPATKRNKIAVIQHTQTALFKEHKREYLDEIPAQLQAANSRKKRNIDVSSLEQPKMPFESFSGVPVQPPLPKPREIQVSEISSEERENKDAFLNTYEQPNNEADILNLSGYSDQMGKHSKEQNSNAEGLNISKSSAGSSIEILTTEEHEAENSNQSQLSAEQKIHNYGDGIVSPEFNSQLLSDDQIKMK